MQCNTERRRDNTLYALEKKGGCVGIAGITRPPGNYKGKGDYTCLSPELSLARISRELRKKASFVILLSQLSIEENRTIAHRNPWINVIIGNKDTTMMKEGETLILPTGLRGEYLGKAAVCYDKKLKKYDVTVEMILLKEGIEEDIYMRKLLDGLYREHLGIHIESGPPPQKIVTAHECRTCHPTAYKQWSSTKHAEAFDDLVNKGRGQHPGCVECHATIEKSTASLFERKIYREQCGIQCTVCHRKDKKHYRSGRLLVEKDCTPCHDREHSRDFEFTAYRKKIEMREKHRELQKR